MDKREAIQFLRDQIDELPTLVGLHYDNGDYLLWRNQIEDVLGNIFGRDSDEYKRFVDAHPKRPRTSTLDGSAEARWYIDEIKAREIALKSIIKNYELFGIEEEPAVKPESEGTNELPIYLFDKMQFHHEIVTASKSLFETKHYAEAIFEAFKAVENFVREKTELSLYGKQLMATVFNEDNPLIQVTEAGKENRDAQEGFKF
ncbi:TIGR02391 family protein, partial [Chloroflexota bacterium]